MLVAVALCTPVFLGAWMSSTPNTGQSSQSSPRLSGVSLSPSRETALVLHKPTAFKVKALCYRDKTLPPFPSPAKHPLPDSECAPGCPTCWPPSPSCMDHKVVLTTGSETHHPLHSLQDSEAEIALEAHGLSKKIKKAINLFATGKNRSRAEARSHLCLELLHHPNQP